MGYCKAQSVHFAKGDDHFLSRVIQLKEESEVGIWIVDQDFIASHTYKQRSSVTS